MCHFDWKHTDKNRANKTAANKTQWKGVMLCKKKFQDKIWAKMELTRCSLWETVTTNSTNPQPWSLRPSRGQTQQRLQAQHDDRPAWQTSTARRTFEREKFAARTACLQCVKKKNYEEQKRKSEKGETFWTFWMYSCTYQKRWCSTTQSESSNENNQMKVYQIKGTKKEVFHSSFIIIWYRFIDLLKSSNSKIGLNL